MIECALCLMTNYSGQECTSLTFRITVIPIYLSSNIISHIRRIGGYHDHIIDHIQQPSTSKFWTNDTTTQYQ